VLAFLCLCVFPGAMALAGSMDLITMTIPNRRSARIGYAIVVATVAFVWQFALFWTNGLLWALFIAAPLVPLIDRRWPGEKFSWRPDARADAAIAR